MTAVETLSVKLCFGLYLGAAVLYVIGAMTRSPRVGRWASVMAGLGVATNTTGLVARGVAAGRMPGITMYEYLLAFAEAVAVAYLVIAARSRTRADMRLVGALALLLAGGLLAYGTSLSPGAKQVAALIPVLRSNWLIFHISAALIGYSIAAVGTVMAALCLARSRWPGPGSGLRRLPEAAPLNQAAYRCVAVAFPFLTLVNITGAIWAYDAWGQYWTWDPKETWSLITWLTYAFYLHARVHAGWRGVRANWVVVMGFASIMFTFIGVSQLPAFRESLHSYATKSLVGGD